MDDIENANHTLKQLTEAIQDLMAVGKGDVAHLLPRAEQSRDTLAEQLNGQVSDYHVLAVATLNAKTVLDDIRLMIS